ncbi:hypothetical protein [Polaribacter sp. SA4-12]|uniref:hypothetical protein n=1 Tax=Polaribacter sp. SA4-12 TaxID=1312072 RepID=UPI000B3CB822|nr:hypothetical protein [Polaribacter sp. SA4-12]ARV14826.1 hypothetical protein BTO07_06530 [Polaribacter sp. SA4-12]
MIDFEKILKETVIPNNESLSIQMVETFFIKKYGSRLKAKIAFGDLLEKSIDNKDFEEKLKSELGVDILLEFLQLFNAAKDFTSLIDLMQEFREKKLKGKTKEEAVEIYKKLSILDSMSKSYNIPEALEKEIINKVNENTVFTLAQTRKELGYPDPRTFNPWLEVFFDNKYDKRILEKGRNAGKISLLEYLEIISAFMLSYDESKFDFNNISEVNRRFREDKKTQKKFLRKLTDNNYSYLKDKISDIKYLSENKIINIDVSLRDEKTFRNMPFSIVSIIKSELKNY